MLPLEEEGKNAGGVADVPGVDDDGDAAVVTLLVVEPLPDALAVTAELVFNEPAVVVVAVEVVFTLSVAAEAPLLITGELRLPNSDLLGEEFTGVSGVSKSGSNGSLKMSPSPFGLTESCPS